MTSHTENGQIDPPNSAIKPTEILLTRATAPEPVRSVPDPGMRHIWIALGVLLLIAAAVIFVLPRYISAPAPNTESPVAEVPAGSNTGTATTTSSVTPGNAPWQTAQLARQRDKSQQILAQMLELQEQLEQKNVRAWAGTEYDRILQLAVDGDAAYQEQEFERSTTLYGDAAAAMTALLNNMDTMFGQAVNEGNIAIANGDAAGAEKAFQQALVIKPESEPALTGMQRAKTLDQVLQLLTEGNDLQQNGNLEQARQRYEQALKLDTQMEPAQQQLQVVNAKIRDAEFTRLMSAGYAQLQNNNLSGAKDAFEKARRLKPGSTEVMSALAQIQGRMTNDQINTLLQNAARLEKDEQWQQAADEYDRALALDANLAAAQEGKQYTLSRARLDDRLEQILAKPDRLSDQAVHTDALTLYQQAVAINPAEPRLAAQLQKLDRLLAVSQEPVAIHLRSDNLTDITVLRVGTQGRFIDKNLMLLPGNYTALGTREGYRDVRVEFKVSADAPAQTVEISATEKIASR